MPPARKPDDLFVGALCALLGAPLLAAPWALAEGSPDYAKRWLVFAFGVMMQAVAAQFARQRVRARCAPELNALLDAAAGTVVFGVFAAVFLAPALWFGGEIRGGPPWLSPGAHDVLGRVLFGAAGVLLGLLTLGWIVVLVRRLRAYLAG
jgi:hypothetical protein